jgi:hypothetical protein
VIKVIATTTINAPTEAIRKFDQMDGWHLVVAGDLKTPGDYALQNGTYLSPEQQTRLDPELSDAIGWNCIQRRNMAVLAAYEMGADVIALVDDDNIPLEHWGKDLLLEQSQRIWSYSIDQPAFDPVGATNYPHLWHRGFPLQLLADRLYPEPRPVEIVPDVQADFWNGDPDIDAICRMEHRPECTFDESAFPFTSTAVSPFNSQNTFITRAVVPHYFMYPHVGRMDDIWASFYVQSLGFRVVYARPSVVQVRNEHDLTQDMTREFLGYEHNLRLINNLAADPNSIREFLPDTAQKAFALYQRRFS